MHLKITDYGLGKYSFDSYSKGSTPRSHNWEFGIPNGEFRVPNSNLRQSRKAQRINMFIRIIAFMQRDPSFGFIVNRNIQLDFGIHLV